MLKELIGSVAHPRRLVDQGLLATTEVGVGAAITN